MTGTVKSTLIIYNISYEGDVAKDGSSNNFKLTEGTGQYEIRWYFNKAEQKVTVTKQ